MSRRRHLLEILLGAAVLLVAAALLFFSGTWGTSTKTAAEKSSSPSAPPSSAPASETPVGPETPPKDEAAAHSAGNAAASSPVKPAEAPSPFRAGEKLTYRILWSTFSVKAGNVQLTVLERRALYGRDAWHFQASAHTIDTMRLLFSLDDQFDSYSEANGLVGLQYEMYLREQGKHQDAVYRLAPEGEPAPSAGSAVRVPPGTRDPFGLLYYLRAHDWQRSREFRSPVFDGRKLYEVTARLQQESVEVSVPAGSFSASRIEIHVFERGVEVPQTRFWAWLARDARRTPVLVEAELPFGVARVELTRGE